jgi:hypothetical protein
MYAPCHVTKAVDILLFQNPLVKPLDMCDAYTSSVEKDDSCVRKINLSAAMRISSNILK